MAAPGGSKPSKPRARKTPAKATSRRTTKAERENRVVPVEDYEHRDATRVNNPPAGLAHLDRERTPTKTLDYDPHLDPELVWAGKVERSEVKVPAPSIHVHEELSAQKIVGSIRRQRLQPALFDVDQLDPDKAVEFYEHDLAWSNRMILGDSLVVMTSLLERERLAGQVQSCYFDPPYAVDFNSNFQPRISDHNVTDGRDEDLTREPEMIQAYRDTWELGVHSYLTYMRDRLAVVRELLSESGSLFLQIGVDNFDLVKALVGEVFGRQNVVTVITMQKTTQSRTTLLGSVCDYIIWVAKDRTRLKYKPLFADRRETLAGTGAYTNVQEADGTRRPMTPGEKRDPGQLPEGARVFAYDNSTSPGYSPTKTVPITLDGQEYHPGANVHWKLRVEGMMRLAELGRLVPRGKRPSIIRFADESGIVPLTNIWTDTVGQNQFGGPKRYVVQTALKAIQRCLLMSTDPGDLVLDPTCGSGSTAVVAEQFGRRWITTDTSRVALALARERLLTRVFDYYQLRDERRGVDGGLEYRTEPWVKASAIGYDDDELEDLVLLDQPKIDNRRTRVSGPFTMEALSRYAQNPLGPDPSSEAPPEAATSHVQVLLDALRTQGIPRPGTKPLKIESLTEMATTGPLQADGVVETAKGPARFAVSLGPQFGAITMAQVSDALRQAIGFDLVVFAGFAVSADAQDKLATGRIGSTDVALLMANPDLLVGDLLKNTSASQTFRLYAAPDVSVDQSGDEYRVQVNGVDSFDAATGDITSYGQQGVQSWFLDDDFDGMVFRASQAFFPVTDAWQKLEQALRGTVDADLVGELHGWTSLPFQTGTHKKVAVRVITNDGNAAEVVIDLPGLMS